MKFCRTMHSIRLLFADPSDHKIITLKLGFHLTFRLAATAIISPPKELKYAATKRKLSGNQVLSLYEKSILLFILFFNIPCRDGKPNLKVVGQTRTYIIQIRYLIGLNFDGQNFGHQ